MLLGEIGLILLVIEAGLEIDLLILKQVGCRGIIVGFLGSICTLALGIAIGYAFKLNFKQSFALGACFAPSSMGIVVVCLKDGDALNTPIGQLIVAAAVVEDVIALMTLSELKIISSGSILDFVVPIVSALAFSTFFTFFAIQIVPYYFRKLLDWYTHDSQLLLLALLTIVTIGLMTTLHYGRSSYLLGAFLAGLCFCTLPEAVEAWHHHVGKISRWTLRIFFACTVGFQVPIASFWNTKVIGMAFAILVCLAGKISMGIFCDPFNIRNVLTIALSMATWGEFSFIIAISSKSLGILDNDTYCSIIFAVLISIIISPTLLRFHLIRIAAYDKEHLVSISEDATIFHTHVYYKFHLKAANVWGIQTGILANLNSFDLEVIDFHSAISDDNVFYQCYLKDLLLKDDAPETETCSGLTGRISEILKHVDGFLKLRLKLPIDEDTYTLKKRDKKHFLVRFQKLHPKIPIHIIMISRWLPSKSGEEEMTEYGRDEAKAQSRMMEQGFIPTKKLVEDANTFLEKHWSDDDTQNINLYKLNIGVMMIPKSINI